MEIEATSVTLSSTGRSWRTAFIVIKSLQDHCLKYFIASSGAWYQLTNQTLIISWLCRLQIAQQWGDLLQACLVERSLSMQRLALFSLLLDAHNHTMFEFLLFKFGHHVSIFVRPRLRNLDQQNQLQKRQMADHSQRLLLLLRLKMLRWLTRLAYHKYIVPFYNQNNLWFS